MATLPETKHPQGNGTLTLHVAGDEFETQFTADQRDIDELNELDRMDEWYAEVDHFERVVFGERAL